MLISMTECLKKYNVEPRGIIHIGIHEGQECQEYINLGFKEIICFDANEDYIKKLQREYPTIFFFAAAITDYSGTIEFNITNNGQSSSILELGKHSEIYPEITYIEKRSVVCNQLDNYSLRSCNVINLDIQGAELKALQGAKTLLNSIDMIYTEVNLDELYKGCCRLEELDEYLSTFGFVRKEMFLAHPSWGDAVYVKQN